MTTLPTRPMFPPARWLARWYVRMRLRSVEFDLAVQDEQARVLPKLTRIYEREAAELRVQLALLQE